MVNKHFLVFYEESDIADLLEDKPSFVDLVQYDRHSDEIVSFFDSFGLPFCCVPSYVFWREERETTNPDGLTTLFEPAYAQLCLGHVEAPYSWDGITTQTMYIF